MPVTPLDWTVPVAILLCGLTFVAMRFMGFATLRWGYALCCLGIGYALMLFETDHAMPFKQIVEDNFVLAGIILACWALNDRMKLDNSLAFDLSVMFASTIMIVIARTMFESARLESLFVQACCAFVLWRGATKSAKLAATKSDKLLSASFILLAMLLTVECVIYITVPGTGQALGAWRSSIWGILIQYTGLIGSIILVFSVMIATTYDAIEKYRAHANTDPLTNLLNRRGLDTLLASPRGRPFKEASTAVVVADLDHFKSINDRFGHPFGDLVIERFGALLQAHAAAQGCVVRLGGEEFAVLLPDTRLDDAVATADKIRRAFVVERWSRNGKGSEFTASFGVTLVKYGEELSTTFERADRLLYVAKRAGRDCIVAGEDVTAETEESRLVFVGQTARDGPGYFIRAANENASLKRRLQARGMPVRALSQISTAPPPTARSMDSEG